MRFIVMGVQIWQVRVFSYRYRVVMLSGIFSRGVTLSDVTIYGKKYECEELYE